MEWFQLGQFSWMGWQSYGWLWVARQTATQIAGTLLATGSLWIVLDESGIPLIPQLPQPPAALPLPFPMAA